MLNGAPFTMFVFLSAFALLKVADEAHDEDYLIEAEIEVVGMEGPF